MVNVKVHFKSRGNSHIFLKYAIRFDVIRWMCTSWRNIMTVRNFFSYYVFPFFILSLIEGAAVLFGTMMNSSVAVPLAIMIIGLVLFYWWKRKKMDKSVYKMNVYIFLAVSALDLILLLISNGSFHSSLISILGVPLFPFIPMIVMYLIIGSHESLHLVLFLTLFASVLISRFFLYGTSGLKKLLIPVLAGCLFLTSGYMMYRNSPQQKYSGHGFDYMNGYSSTDFSDRMVYSSPVKLPVLDHPSSLLIENEEEMVRMDGAEACYPMYASIALNIYQNIAEIEKSYVLNNKPFDNGKYVTFTNSVNGYSRLIDGNVDLFFGARPSVKFTEWAESMGKEIMLEQIASEAFVFFTQADNPVDSLTSEQVKAIYHGDITNWKEVGGKDQEIVAFQRPAESGSQIMMEYFMGDVSLKQPLTYEIFDSMAGVINVVAQYHNEKGALGYTFRYFLEELHQEKNVKMIAIDGVEPTAENISSGAYPLITPVYCAYMADNQNPSVQKILDFLLSEDGQYLISKSGYAPLN